MGKIAGDDVPKTKKKIKEPKTKVARMDLDLRLKCNRNLLLVTSLRRHKEWFNF